MELVLTQNNGTTTMTSLQLVDYINYLRKKDSPLDYTELRHDDFMRKVPQVLKAAPINFGVVNYVVNQGATRERKIAIFEKREAMLMAMSYSYDIQAVVYDAWEAAENALLDNSTITLPNFLNPAEAAKAWAVQYERNVESTKQLVIAQEKVAEALPKIEAFDTYMEKGSNIDGDNASRVLKVGRNKLYDSLRKNGYFTNKNLPSQQFTQKGSGLFYTIVTWQTDNYGFEHEKVKVLFTPKGIEYFTRKVAQGKLL
jgi:phage antirepressor YoqD-like protein